MPLGFDLGRLLPTAVCDMPAGVWPSAKKLSTTGANHGQNIDRPIKMAPHWFEMLELSLDVITWGMFAIMML